tara:strand:+ start:266 stop:478 length:213 start_codon:yes stop_codon:yes gene_type:complete
MANIFSEPKALKKWAIALANACGGQQVSTTPMMTKINPNKITTLMDKFVEDHNENVIKVAEELNKQKEEE